MLLSCAPPKFLSFFLLRATPNYFSSSISRAIQSFRCILSIQSLDVDDAFQLINIFFRIFFSFRSSAALLPSIFLRLILPTFTSSSIRAIVGQSQENHNNLPVISQSPNIIIAEPSSQLHQVTTQTSRTINQTLQSINNNNNNNNNSTIAKSKIHLNVDQQISSDSKDDESLLSHEPNNNTNKPNSSSSSSRTSCFRHHPVSRRGTEFISQQVPGFRSFGGNNRYITQKNK